LGNLCFRHDLHDLLDLLAYISLHSCLAIAFAKMRRLEETEYIQSPSAEKTMKLA